MGHRERYNARGVSHRTGASRLGRAFLAALAMLLLVCNFALAGETTCIACGAPNGMCANPAACEYFRCFKLALELVDVPEKVLNDHQRLHDALALFNPIEAELTPELFMELLLYLRADARDYTPEEAFYAYQFLRTERAAWVVNPQGSCEASDWWLAIGINSALQGKDYELLRARYAAAGIDEAQIPREEMFAVIDREVSAVTTAPAGGDEMYKAEKVELSRAEAEVIKAVKEAQDVAEAQVVLAKITDLHRLHNPGMSSEPLHQIERATKNLLKNSTKDLDLVTAMVELRGKKAVQGGLFGVLLERGKTPADKPKNLGNNIGDEKLLSSPDAIIRNLNRRAEYVDAQLAADALSALFTPFNRNEYVDKTLLANRLAASRTSSRSFPLISVNSLDDLDLDPLQITRDINAALRQHLGVSIGGLHFAQVTVNFEPLFEQIICVVTDESDTKSGNVKILVDDGFLRVRDPDIDMQVNTNRFAYLGLKQPGSLVDQSNSRDTRISEIIEEIDTDGISREEAEAIVKKFLGWTGEYAAPQRY